MPCNSQQCGSMIRALRKRKNLSQEVLSGFACLSRSHLAAIENGTVSPSVDTLGRILDALGISLSQFFRLIEEDTPPEPRVSG